MQRVQGLPSLGETRNEGEVAVALDEPFIDGAVQPEREHLIQRVRIEGSVVALGGEAERPGLRGSRERGRERDDACDDGSTDGHRQGPPVPLKPRKP
jgi:hypothetical protein